MRFYRRHFGQWQRAHLIYQDSLPSGCIETYWTMNSSVVCLQIMSGVRILKCLTLSRQLSTHLLVSGVTGQWWGQRQTLRAVTQAPMNLVTSDAGKTGDRFDIGSETVELVVSVHLASLLWGRGPEMERLRREWSWVAVTCGWHCWSPVAGAGGSEGGLTTCCWLRWRGLTAPTPPGPPSHHPHHSWHPAHHQDTHSPLRLPRHMTLRCQPDCPATLNHLLCNSI